MHEVLSFPVPAAKRRQVPRCERTGAVHQLPEPGMQVRDFLSLLHENPRELKRLLSDPDVREEIQALVELHLELFYFLYRYRFGILKTLGLLEDARCLFARGGGSIVRGLSSSDRRAWRDFSRHWAEDMLTSLGS